MEKIEILSVEEHKAVLTGWIPSRFDDILDRAKEELAPMREEAPRPTVYQAAVLEQLKYYITNAPEGVSIASNVNCAGVGVGVSGPAMYWLKCHGATLPTDGCPIVKTEAAVDTEVGRLTEYGRMGGPMGWDETRDLVAGALASFSHNWVGILTYFRRRPTLPLSNPWPLPNMVLEETKAPEQFHLPASVAYSMWRPSFIKEFHITIRSPTPTKVGIDFWDSYKKDMARADELDLPEGDVIIKMRMTSAMPTVGQRGIININPIDAPQGLTVTGIDTRPRSV